MAKTKKQQALGKRNIELLMLKSVENVGIVGDVVKVKPGFARNYLLPLGIAEAPTPSKIESLKEERAKAEAQLLALRGAREELLQRMHELTLTIERSCNAKGVLYGSVNQRDIADALQEKGYDVGVRSIRVASAIRHIGDHSIPVQFDKDLRTEVTLVIEPDAPLEEREEMEFDDEGNLIDPAEIARRREKDKAKEARRAERRQRDQERASQDDGQSRGSDEPAATDAPTA